MITSLKHGLNGQYWCFVRNIIFINTSGMHRLDKVKNILSDRKCGIWNKIGFIVP